MLEVLVFAFTVLVKSRAREAEDLEATAPQPFSMHTASGLHSQKQKEMYKQYIYS